MAELFGIAASGIGLAEVAGKIISTSLAIKRLLDDVKELPESFKLLLDRVDILTPVLVEASCDANGSSTTPSALDRALGAAAQQCSRALDQLKSLASELSEQIEQSRGFKRKLITAKIALRKDVVIKHEKRLDNAVQLLFIAQQTCIL
jgi:ABC-type transporter Mla subunit MlaD